MKNLTGSEKQIAWATEIREQLAKQLPILRDAAEKHEHPQVEKVERKNPLTKQVTIVEVVSVGLTPEHEIARSMTRAWWPEYAPDGVVADGKHAAFFADTANALEKAINGKTEAGYWIERRAQ